MRFDRNAEALAIKGLRAAVSAMPDTPSLAIAILVKALGINSHALGDYLHRALFGIAGSAGHVRYAAWGNALHGRRDDRMVDLPAMLIEGQEMGLRQLL